MGYTYARRTRLAVGTLIIIACIAAAATVVLHSRQEVAHAASVRVDTVGIPKPLTPRANTVAFLGDSYTAGSGSGGYDHAFATLVSAYEGWTYRNFAYGGTGYITSVKTNASKGCGVSFCPEYGAVLPDVVAFRPTVVIVSGGRNDVGKPQEAVSDGVDAFYESLRRNLPKAQIIATSPIWDSRRPPTELLLERAAVQHAVKQVHGVYLNLGEPLGGHDELVSSDGVHPNSEGHAAIAHAIEVAISRNAKLASALKTGA